MRTKYVCTTFFFIFFISCNSTNNGEQKILDDAFLKQKEAIELIDQMERELNQLTHPKKDSLLQLVEELEEGIYAIPGYALELPGHEGHDHGRSEIKLSAEEIFKVQNELLEQI